MYYSVVRHHISPYCVIFSCRGARLEKADKDNFTPLLIAASFGHVETLKVLLELGANVFAVDKNEKTAMHWACEEDHLDVLQVRQLLIPQLLQLFPVLI